MGPLFKESGAEIGSYPLPTPHQHHLPLKQRCKMMRNVYCDKILKVKVNVIELLNIIIKKTWRKSVNLQQLPTCMSRAIVLGSWQGYPIAQP